MDGCKTASDVASISFIDHIIDSVYFGQIQIDLCASLKLIGQFILILMLNLAKGN